MTTLERRESGAVAGTGRRAAGALEREVVAVLASAREPLTAHAVLAELDRSLAYTTVMTTLNRLCEKGAAVRAPGSGRAFTYALAGEHDQISAAVTARQMRKLLDAGTDRAGALARFVDELTPDDEQTLAQLLDSADTGQAARVPRRRRRPAG